MIASDGASVLPIGGFDGGDPVPTLARFQQMVADGEVTYVLGTGGMGGTADGSASGSSVPTQIRTWVEASCTRVTDAPGDATLYACASSASVS